MKLIIVSGRSGSGKSTALNILEDAGFSCIDNLPAALLPTLVDRMMQERGEGAERVAVSIDARNLPSDLQNFPDVIQSLDRRELDFEIIYLDASGPSLMKRFSETRRRHPLTSESIGLRQALEYESEVLEHIVDLADLTIDTTRLSMPQLSDIIRQRVVEKSDGSMSLQFLSFGFKHGVPVDADVVFDVRCLPNPHWIPRLRPLTGMDAPVAEYLRQQQDVRDMRDDIQRYLLRWLPSFERNNRAYMTVAIGCTGGQHRSVYLAHQIATFFRDRMTNVLLHHRELEPAGND